MVSRGFWVFLVVVSRSFWVVFSGLTSLVVSGCSFLGVWGGSEV